MWLQGIHSLVDQGNGFWRILTILWSVSDLLLYGSAMHVTSHPFWSYSSIEWQLADGVFNGLIPVVVVNGTLTCKRFTSEARIKTAFEFHGQAVDRHWGIHASIVSAVSQVNISLSMYWR